VSAVDVVIVPDFAGSQAMVFEARTLLFLGSWLEHQGASRSWPLHVAAIGEAPESVHDLASRCGAILSCHDDLEQSGNRFMNKLRGLEIESRTGRILLVDVDTVVLGDLRPAAELGECISAQLAPRNRLRPELWQEIFEATGVEMPRERVRPWILDYADRLPAHQLRNTYTEEMPPYFRSGLVLAPAECSLCRNWKRIQELLQERYAERRDGAEQLTKGNQYSFSIAIEILRGEGIPYRRLPDPLLVTEPLYAAGVLSYEETLIYHVGRAFRRASREAAFDPARDLELLVDDSISQFFPETWTQKLWHRLQGHARPPAAAPLMRVSERLRDLASRYVVPAFSNGRS
jgi:hypothetical protein